MPTVVDEVGDLDHPGEETVRDVDRSLAFGDLRRMDSRVSRKEGERKGNRPTFFWKEGMSDQETLCESQELCSDDEDLVILEESGP